MKEVHWTLSINRKEDRNKIELLSKRGTLLKMTTICGRAVCWEYELKGAYDRHTKEPIIIKAWIGTGC